MKDQEHYNSLDKRSKEYREYKKGLGDILAAGIKATGLDKATGKEDCEGCKKRQDSLNLLGHKWEHFFKKHKPNEFTNEDKTLWNDFINRTKQHKINTTEQRLIIRLLKDVLNMSVKPCSTCSSSIWKKYIEMIQMVYERN